MKFIKCAVEDDGLRRLARVRLRLVLVLLLCWSWSWSWSWGWWWWWWCCRKLLVVLQHKRRPKPSMAATVGPVGPGTPVTVCPGAPGCRWLLGLLHKGADEGRSNCR